MPGGNQGFPKTARLRKRASFIRMNRGAARVATENFVFLWTPNGLPMSRLGITVTKKVASAVGRNRVKRRLREAFRRAGGSLPPGVDLVALAKPGAQLLDSQSVNRQFQQALQTIRVRLHTTPPKNP
jgi:ribonuclease P protein component